MESKVFDFKELTEFSKNCLEMAQKTMPKETRKFLNKEGYKLRKKTRQRAKAEVKKVTGVYHKGWRKGKVYNYKGDKTNQAVRVFNNARHAHIIEDGRKYTKDGKEYFKQGKHILENSTKDFKSDYYSDIDGFIDEVTNKFW